MMPRDDLSSVSGETDIDTNDLRPPPPEPDVPDYAPGSFWLSKHAEFDWLDQNAFLDRNDSAKGSVISIPNSLSTSQRYSFNIKCKASIIGLPNPQKPNYADRRTYRPPSIRLFPKRPGAVSGRAATFSEPSSPKVSCTGRVRSRKDRKKIAEPELVKPKSVKEKKLGFWKSFRLTIRSKGNKPGCKGTDIASEPVKRSAPDSSIEREYSEPPGLGGVKRFASGRRSDAWGDEVESKSEPLGAGPIWRRRERGPPKEVSVGRSWEAVGPASV